MNRIAIVGHPSSDYMDVEALLKKYGMAEAAPSRREGMSIHKIQDSLFKAHSAVNVEDAQQESELGQLELSNVWQGLVLDLLLGNIEQEGVWGWASPDTLRLLDMWYKVDEQTSFLLVYQHPAIALKNALDRKEDISPIKVLNNWAAYHGALLAFYLRHPERSFLVHTQQLLSQPQDILKALPEFSANPASAIVAPKASRLATALESFDGCEQANVTQLEAEPLARFLSEKVVEQHSALSLFEELQASATYPRECNSTLTYEDAWQYFKQKRTALLSTITSLQQALESESSKSAALKRENETSTNKIASLQQALERESTKSAALKRENETSANKIASLQQALESESAKSAALKRENDALKKTPPAPAVDTTKLQQENSMLLEQLHVVQEELEKLHSQRGVNSAAASIDESYYGADQRIKRQLTYRLGAVVVNSHSIKDFICLPLSLKREYAAYQKDMKARKGEKLPPISQYADAHKAEQVKRHLSYRLGQVIMNHAGSPVGWVKLPTALSREAKAFRKERQS
ncbi:hypothetical protein RVM27_02980 [Halomonas sp. KM007]